MSMYAVIDPATGKVEAEYPTATDDQVEQALATAFEAFRAWKVSAVDARAGLLDCVADLYEQRRDELARIITGEMGKPIRQARGEIDIVVSIYRYYAKNGPAFLADEEISIITGGSAVVRKEGLGVLLGIMPWNYPYYQVARFAAPNLMNGNTILLKHAPQCPRSALTMERIFADAGAIAGAYTNLFATNEQVAGLIADPRVAGVSLTGSERAGAAVAEIAGRNLKKVVLELGGSDPFLVLDKADVAMAAKQAAAGRFSNTGQACNAAKRIIVDAAVYDQFVTEFATAVKALKFGDPGEEDTFIGPLSSAAAREQLAGQVSDAVGKGAQVLMGGHAIDRAGAWYAPTVLAGITPRMRAYREELFGPVAALYKVADTDEAVALANDSPYGLSASVQSTDAAQAADVAARLESGMVFINEPSDSYAELPFGGVKRSGFGRELGKYGMDEFVNRKLIKTRN